jgi:hypothetical protein
LCSPVPTQIVFGFFTSNTTSPIEYVPSFWKIGVHVVPAFVVFHTPPDATPAYHVAGCVGCTTTWFTRPDISAGPIGRKRKEANVPLCHGSFGSAFTATGFGASGLGESGLGVSWPNTHEEHMRKTARRESICAPVYRTSRRLS